MPTTNYMGLVLPTVSVTVGPTWAATVNAAFSQVDSHNHTSGQGIPVPASGLNINADLPHGGFNATGLRTTRFNDQGTALTGINDAGCVYIAGGNLYYNNGTGTAIQLTAGSGLNAASVGGFGGDYGTSTASAFYTSASKLFSFQSNTAPATWAALSIGSLTINDVTAGVTKGIKLQSPVGLASAYTLTFPAALPASSSVLSVDATGAVATRVPILGSQLAASAGITGAQIAATTIARTNLVAVGQQISASCGNFTTTSGALVAVTNLAVTITTSGRPVLLFLQPDGAAAPTDGVLAGAGTGNQLGISLFRGASQISAHQVGPDQAPPGAVSFLDVVGAGTYTYSVQAQVLTGSGTVTVANVKLVAYEL